MTDTNELMHNAKNGFNTRLQGYFEESKDDEGTFFLYEKGREQPIAYIDFTYLPGKNLLYINDMENYRKSGKNAYKGVGRLLHEFVFHWMAQKGVDCPVQLTTAHQSHVFHFKCGYQFINKADNERMQTLIASEPNAAQQMKKVGEYPESMGMSQEVVQERKAHYMPKLQHQTHLKK